MHGGEWGNLYRVITSWRVILMLMRPFIADAAARRRGWKIAVAREDSRPAGARKPRAKMSPQVVLLLAVHGLFAVANALSGTFVNVYLWKSAGDMSLIGRFALAAQAVNAATFFFAGKWVKEYDKMNCLRLGVAGSALFYLIVLLLERRAADFVLLLGAVQGMAGGFFWLSFNVVYFEVTDPDNRDRFNGWAGLLGSVSGMTAPWISGMIIARLGGLRGYRWVFGLSLAVFVIGVIASFFLKKRKVPGQYDWLYGFRKLFSEGDPWRRIVPALAFQGVREGVFAFIIGLLVYIATENEQMLGNYALITSAVGLGSFWLAGKLLTPKYRGAAMLIGAAAMSAVIVPFFWKVNYATLLLFGIGTALVFPLFTIPMTSSVFDWIGKDADSARHRVEYVVLREMALNAGRIAALIVFILVIGRKADPGTLNWLLFATGSFPLLSWVMMRKLLAQGTRFGAP